MGMMTMMIVASFLLSFSLFLCREIAKVENEVLSASSFLKVYEHIKDGTPSWNALKVPESVDLYQWDASSTYIHNPPFFQVLLNSCLRSLSLFFSSSLLPSLPVDFVSLPLSGVLSLSLSLYLPLSLSISQPVCLCRCVSIFLWLSVDR